MMAKEPSEFVDKMSQKVKVLQFQQQQCNTIVPNAVASEQIDRH